jgi:hypothetical protein
MKWRARPDPESADALGLRVSPPALEPVKVRRPRQALLAADSRHQVQQREQRSK